MWLWAFLCTIASGLLIALFFPFIFKIDFELDERGIARLFFFKKQIYSGNKNFGKEKDEAEITAPSPTTECAPPPKPVKPETKVDEAKTPATEKETKTASKPETAQEKSAEPVPDEVPKKEKRSLTDEEFWTLILTPEFDARAWWSVKHWLSALFKLFRIKFQNCFIEGIRMEYQNMGYAAAINAFLKTYPYIGAWDFRMDWTYDHEPRAEGHIRASVNLCRVLGLIVSTLFYGGIVAFTFWRRRAHILKTNELPELGFIRKKIVKMMSEDN